MDPLSPRADDILPVHGRTILEVGLRGWANETSVVVRYLEHGDEVEKAWGVRKGDIVGDHGGQVAPSSFGAVIFSLLTEP